MIMTVVKGLLLGVFLVLDLHYPPLEVKIDFGPYLLAELQER